MPSCWKKLVRAHMIQPVIAFRRRTSAVAAATRPMVALPRYHSQIAQPTQPITSRPFKSDSATSMME